MLLATRVGLIVEKPRLEWELEIILCVGVLVCVGFVCVCVCFMTFLAALPESSANLLCFREGCLRGKNRGEDSNAMFVCDFCKSVFIEANKYVEHMTAKECQFEAVGDSVFVVILYTSECVKNILAFGICIVQIGHEALPVLLPDAEIRTFPPDSVLVDDVAVNAPTHEGALHSLFKLWYIIVMLCVTRACVRFVLLVW